jgi:hypothetical protein
LASPRIAILSKRRFFVTVILATISAQDQLICSCSWGYFSVMT